MPLPQGFRFGSYEIVDRIGAGGMGEVYRARDLKLQRAVAIKVLPSDVSTDATAVARFEREARMLAALNHPHIAQVYGLEEHGGHLALAMELIDGRTLAAALRDAPRHALSSRDSVAIAMQIADALDAAHAQGIVHRDLKPANVMLRGDGIVKVLDFGLAKPANGTQGTDATGTTFAMSERGMIVGTAAYMSPEQARGAAVDQRTDIWAFGCVLFEMLAGKRAFDGATRSDVIAAILRGSPDWNALPSDVPPSLHRLLRRCLVAEPSGRLRAIGDATFELRDTETAASVPVERAPTRTFTWIAVASVVAVMVAGVALVPRMKPGPSAPVTFEKASFRRGYVHGARFGANRDTVIYGAFYDGGPALYESRIGRPEARPLGLGPSEIFSVATNGELAIGQLPRFPLTFLNPGQLAALPIGGAPRAMASSVNAADYLPDGKSLVAAIVESGSRVEWPLGNTIYKTNGTIGSLRVSPAGDRAAFFEYDARGATMMMIDREGHATTVTTGWVVVSGGLAWSPDGKEVWFSGVPARELSRPPRLFAIVPGGEARQVLELPGGVRLQDIAPDGRVLLLAVNGSNSIFTDNARGREQDLSWFGDSIINDITSDGSRIALIEPARQGERGFVLFHRPTAGGPAIRISDNVGGFTARFSNDSKYIASTEGMGAASQIRIDAIDSGETRRIPHPDWIPLTLTWTPDGRQIVYAAFNIKTNEIAVFRRGSDGGAAVRLSGTCSTSLVIDPAGTVAACADRSTLRLMPLDGSPAREITTTEPPGALIRWNTDGHTLQSYRQADLPSAILGVDSRTGAVRKLRDLIPDDMAGVWRIHPVVSTADGRHYAYSATRSMGELLVFSGLR